MLSEDEDEPDVTCDTCHGDGEIMQAVLLPRGHSEQMGPCPDCDGTGRIEIEPKKPVGKGKYDHARNLRYILQGEEVFGAKTWDYLRPLTAKGPGDFTTHEVNFPQPTELQATDDDLSNFGVMEPIARIFPFTTSIVGNSYRDGQQQSALRNKNPGNRVLVIPEPANPHDPHALAVVVAKGISQNRFVWTHVGYVPRTEAKGLSRIWPRYRGQLLVGEGRLVGHPRDDKNPKIMIEGSFRNYFQD